KQTAPGGEMRRSDDKILNTHVGALPGPIEAWSGQDIPHMELQSVVNNVVANQRAAGIDIVNEGELAKGGSFASYFQSRLSGFEPGAIGTMVSVLGQGADWLEFADFYKKALESGTLFEQTRSSPVQRTNSAVIDWVCRGPIRFTGQAALEREIDLLR